MTLSFDERLSRVGFRLAGWSPPKGVKAGAPDIEVTLLDIVQQLPEDGRLFSLALSWIKVHGAYVIVEKLRKLSRRKAESSTLWLPALAAYAVQCRLPKWRALLRKLPEPRYFYPPEVSDGAIAMKGAIPWLESLNFRVPEGSLRIRESDVLSPEQLAAIHRQYRNRYLYGPSWRADIVTAIEEGARSPTEVAKRVGCSYEPAHRVFRELKVSGFKKIWPA